MKSLHKPVTLSILSAFFLFSMVMAYEVIAEDVGKQPSTETPETLEPSAGNIQPTSVAELPDKGVVEISGTVQDVDSKGFTLQDESGEIKVSLKEGQGNLGALPEEGDQVRVVGQVDDGGLLGRKNVEATKITILASIAPNAAGF